MKESYFWFILVNIYAVGGCCAIDKNIKVLLVLLGIITFFFGIYSMIKEYKQEISNRTLCDNFPLKSKTLKKKESLTDK